MRKSINHKTSPILIKRNNNFSQILKIEIKDNKILKKNYKLKNNILPSENKENINYTINLKSIKKKDKKNKNKNQKKKIKQINESNSESQLESENLNEIENNKNTSKNKNNKKKIQIKINNIKKEINDNNDIDEENESTIKKKRKNISSKNKKYNTEKISKKTQKHFCNDKENVEKIKNGDIEIYNQNDDFNLNSNSDNKEKDNSENENKNENENEENKLQTNPKEISFESNTKNTTNNIYSYNYTIKKKSNKFYTSHQKSKSENLIIIQSNQEEKKVPEEKEKKLKQFPEYLNKKPQKTENNELKTEKINKFPKNKKLFINDRITIGGLMNAINKESKKNFNRTKLKLSVLGNYNYDDNNNSSSSNSPTYKPRKKIKYEGKKLKSLNINIIDKNEMDQRHLMFKLKKDLNDYLSQSDQWSENDKNKFLQFKEKIDVLNIRDIHKYIEEIVGMNEQIEDIKEIREMEKRINFFKDRLIEQITYNNNKREFLESKIKWKDNMF